jgi:hypothetical protein
LADAALADAQIACWESKYFYNFWRPIPAIRLGDQDDNPATEVDPDWKPLINTPNFPEYPSGRASVSGAAPLGVHLALDDDLVPSLPQASLWRMASPRPLYFKSSKS